VKVLAAAVGEGVGAVVGAAVGLLGVAPVLLVLPHAMTPMASTRLMTTKNASFGNTFMSVLLLKKCSSLVSTTPYVCDEAMLTTYLQDYGVP
jgi:hypothetical protein